MDNISLVVHWTSRFLQQGSLKAVYSQKITKVQNPIKTQLADFMIQLWAFFHGLLVHGESFHNGFVLGAFEATSGTFISARSGPFLNYCSTLCSFSAPCFVLR